MFHFDTYSFPAFSFAVLVGHSSTEKFPQRDDAPLTQEVLTRNRTRDSSDVYADVISDRGHRQRLEIKLALIEEIKLILDYRRGHAEQGIFSLCDCVHNPLGRANIILKEFLGLPRYGFVHHHLAVIITDSKIRQIRFGEPDGMTEFIFSMFDNDISGDNMIEHLAELQAGRCVEFAHPRNGMVNLLDGAVHLFGYFRQMIFKQLIHITTDQSLFKGHVLAAVFHLYKQAIGKVACADSNWFELLYE